MTKKINWGIIGLGRIANKFAEDLLLSSDAVLYGVASRDINKVIDFATKFNAIKYFGSYQELANDSEIDIIYIATPHTLHFENAMMCLKSNKAVLCEKPMGMNAQQVQQMISEAKSRNLFLMEGLWTRFIPATEKLIELLDKQTIGEVQSVRADFGFKGDLNFKSRVYDKKLGGGSLLDVGIYPIYLSLIVLGQPTAIEAKASFMETKVDGSCAMVFKFENGSKANLESSIETNTPTEAYITGTKGVLKLHRRFHHSEKMSITQNGETETIDIKYKGSGYIHEIEEVNNCLLDNKTESTKLPLATSLDLISVIDRVREEIGLKYDN